jgi:hypothetical protein
VIFYHGVEPLASVPEEFSLIIVEFIKLYQNIFYSDYSMYKLRKILPVKPQIRPSFKLSASAVQT